MTDSTVAVAEVATDRFQADDLHVVRPRAPSAPWPRACAS